MGAEITVPFDKLKVFFLPSSISPIRLLGHVALQSLKSIHFNGKYTLSIYAGPYSSLQSIYSFNPLFKLITPLQPAAHVQSL